jgi:short-subunit dehydrogenase
MLNQGGGAHIVNIASLAGLVGFPFTAPYTATKFAVVGLTEAVAMELKGRGITFTTVCPGAVATNLMHDGQMELPGKWAGRIRDAVDRLATSPEVIADRILKAVIDRTPLIIPTPGILPLWWIKRLFDGPYRSVTCRLAGALEPKP